jgi:hypothetical protein
MFSIGACLSALGWIALLHATLEVVKCELASWLAWPPNHLTLSKCNDVCPPTDREYLEILSDEFVSLPFHLTVEVAIGAVLASAGDLQISLPSQ